MAVIILQILKIIGIVLLVLLLLLLSLMLLILFFPFRYKGIFSKDASGIDINVKLWWLFGIVRLLYQYPEPGKPKCMILWFDVLNRRKKPPKQKRTKVKREKKSKKEKYSSQINTALLEKRSEVSLAGSEHNISAAERIDLSAADNLLDNETAEPNTSSEAAETTVQKKSVFQKLADIINTIRNLPEKLQNIVSKIQHTADNISYYKDLLTSSETAALWKRLKPKIGKILLHLLPRKIEGSAVIGTGEPDTTAYVYGLYSVIRSVIPMKFYMDPDFEEKRVEGKLFIKGHFSTFEIVLLAVKLLFDKEFKMFIKKLKTGGQQNG